MNKFNEMLMCVPHDIENVQGFDELKEVFRVVQSANVILKQYLYGDWSLFVELDLINCERCGGTGKQEGTIKWCGTCIGDGVLDGEPSITAAFESHVKIVSEYTGRDIEKQLIEWSATCEELPFDDIINDIVSRAYPAFAKHITSYNLKHFDL